MRTIIYPITITISILIVILSYFILDIDIFLKFTSTTAFLFSLCDLVYTMDCMIIPWRIFNRKIATIMIIVAIIFGGSHIFMRI